MAKKEIDLSEILSNLKPEETMKTILQYSINEMIKRELSSKINAESYERNGERSNYRNGSRLRELKTSLGKIEIEIPKLRQGSFFPSILEKYQRIDRAMIYTIQEAYVNGVATRKMKKLFKDLEFGGLERNAVSEVVKPVIKIVSEWNNRKLESDYVYIWLDGISTNVRESGAVLEPSVLIGIGLRKDGFRDVLGFHINKKESYFGWKEFLQKLKKRGLKSSGLWIRDQHEGIAKSLAECFTGQLQQRCIVHWQRNLMDKLNSKDKEKYGSKISAFVNSSTVEQFKETEKSLLRLFDEHFIYDWLEETLPQISNYAIYPENHWRKIKSTNPIERLNEDIRKRERNIRIFPNEKSCELLIGAILSEKSEEWVSGKTYIGKDLEKSIRLIDSRKKGNEYAAENILNNAAPEDAA